VLRELHRAVARALGASGLCSGALVLDSPARLGARSLYPRERERARLKNLLRYTSSARPTGSSSCDEESDLPVHQGSDPGEITLFRALTWIRRFGRAGPEGILNAPRD